MSLEIEKGKVYRFIVDGQKADYVISFNGLFQGKNKILILGLNPNDTPRQSVFLTSDQAENKET